MRSRSGAAVAVLCAGFTVAILLATVVLFSVSTAVRGTGLGGAWWALPFAFMAVIGSLLIWKRPENSVGWILAASGLLMTSDALAQDYPIFAYAASPPRPGAALASWFGFWLWMPSTALLALLFHVFPTGSPPSRLWRPFVWAGVGVAGASLPAAALIWGSRGRRLLEAATVSDVPGGDALFIIGNPGAGVILLSGLISLGLRFKRSRGEERQQILWLLFAASLMVASFLLAGLVTLLTGNKDPISNPLVALFALIASASVPVAAGVAILRYRLYDIDLVVNRTVVYGALAAFITAVYVGTVVGVGSWLGAGDEPNLTLSLAATALVAVAFQPVRERVQKLANRLVYGQRLSPYEAVTSFSHRMAEALPFADVLPHVAQAAVQAVGGQAASAKLYFPSGGSSEATWPASEAPPTGSFDARFTVSHKGEAVGEIAVKKKRGEQLSPQERRLLTDLSSQAGIAFSNIRLTEELKARLVELQSSRKRIVSVQERERRRIERDIHDGAQQQLVSLAVKLGLLGQVMGSDRDKAEEILRQLRTETEEALETLRDLARGIFPPLLADRGLVAALEAHVAKHGLRCEVSVQGGRTLPRLPQQVEAAVFFCCLEAMQNATKHAPDSAIAVVLDPLEDRLEFRISDDGPGFDPAASKNGSGLQNMKDRIEALGGSLEVTSSPGAGVQVRGAVPHQAGLA